MYLNSGSSLKDYAILAGIIWTYLAIQFNKKTFNQNLIMQVKWKLDSILYIPRYIYYL